MSEAAAPGLATLQGSRVDSTSEADAAASRLAADLSAACVNANFGAQGGDGEISRTAPLIAATATVSEAAAPGLATLQGSRVDSTVEAGAAASRLAAEHSAADVSVDTDARDGDGEISRIEPSIAAISTASEAIAPSLAASQGLRVTWLLFHAIELWGPNSNL